MSSATASGRLIINADDWGRDRLTTDRTLACVLRGTVSSVSAMVLMKDSERSAGIAREHGVDACLHLNLTTPFDAAQGREALVEHQRSVTRYLRGHRLAQVVYHPGLARSFEYVVRTQLEEYGRLFGKPPDRIDGHHHMHLCANVQRAKLLPEGTILRRSFSFFAGEKGLINRLYRQAVDRALGRRHRLTDYFFSLPPFDPPSRIARIVSLAEQNVVEAETHPVNPEEYDFLTGDGILQATKDVRIADHYEVAGGQKSGQCV